ncbi:hypothetical protein ACLKA7_003843 [Drosophila subpalustris]
MAADHVETEKEAKKEMETESDSPIYMWRFRATLAYAWSRVWHNLIWSIPQCGESVCCSVSIRERRQLVNLTNVCTPLGICCACRPAPSPPFSQSLSLSPFHAYVHDSFTGATLATVAALTADTFQPPLMPLTGIVAVTP